MITTFPTIHRARRDTGSTSSTGQLWRPATLDLTIVVPYYNPGDRVRRTVDQLLDTLGRSGVTFEVVAVSDGSTDGSEASLVGLPGNLVQAVRLEHNQGKGEALRVGFSMSRGRYVGFVDADGDIPPAQVTRFAAVARRDGDRPDVVVGSKRHPDSEVVFPPVRRLYSGVWQQLVRALFHLKARDTQTGLKLFRREVLAEALPWTVEKRFAFDLELLVVANRLGYRQVEEVPVRIVERQGSTVSLKSALVMFGDLLSIFFRLQFPPFPDLPAPARATAGARLADPILAETTGPAGGPAEGPAAGPAPMPPAEQLVVWTEPAEPAASPDEIFAAVARSEARFADAGRFDAAELVLAGRDH